MARPKDAPKLPPHPKPIDRIHPVCGLPRTGSTVLLNLLAQHPLHRVTATNGLANLLSMTAQSWTRNEAFRAQGLLEVQPKIVSALEGMVTGFHAEDLGGILSSNRVFDKSRMWLGQIGLIQQVMGKKRVIVCIRDVRDIVASLEELYQRNPLSRGQMPDSTVGRVQMLLSPGGVVGAPIIALRDAIRQGHLQNMIPVRYQELTEDPLKTLHHLHLDLGIEAWGGYDPDNVKQVTSEDDMLLAGLPGLHDVKPKVQPGRRDRWRGVIPEGLARQIDSEYSDIQSLVYGQR